MSFKIVKHTLSSPLATGGTITLSYPAGTSKGTFAGGREHFMVALQNVLEAPSGITITLNAASFVVTYKGATTIPTGEEVVVQLDSPGIGEGTPGPLVGVKRASYAPLVQIDLGSPAASDPNGAVESQACTLANGLATGINGALAASGVARFDVPRNVVAAWTGTAVLTVTGLDEYGAVVVESSASGTSLAGKKAFAAVTNVTTSANITGLTVGTGQVLGLPIFLPAATSVLVELQDLAAAVAGTVVAGVAATPTATTGDVRGTYTPNATVDGDKGFKLLVSVPDPTDIGPSNFAG
jgi:hypothetical protein